jgi:phosphatidate cytidylyltransferase
MFRTRLLSGIVLVALALVFIIAGGDVLLAVTGVISLIGMFELYRVFGMEKAAPGVIGYLAAIVYYLNLRFGFLPDDMVLYIGFLTLLMFAFVFAYPKYHTSQIMGAFFGFFYVAVMLSYVYHIRMLEHGLYFAFLIFLCSWGCDTCAYCVGKLLGKHKMTPKLSPKKSVEGAIGGVAGAALLTALYCYIFRAQMELGAEGILAVTVVAGVAALISMVGDLTASAIKRNYDIKDYGHLIPGHGGILDRFDSMIITAPIIYFLTELFIS